MKKPKIFRVWVNQPSTLQTDHKYHGKRGIAVDDGSHPLIVDIWFVDGDVARTRIFKSSLAKIAADLAPGASTTLI